MERSRARKEMPPTAESEKRAVSNDKLTAVLAERVMGWRVGPQRFLLEGRRWMPRWRFRPTDRLADAFKLLERVTAEHCDMGQTPQGFFVVELQIGGGHGRACEKSKPLAITLAVARALGLDVDS